MNISGLHILLTYRCTRSCSHCFVWGSPGVDTVLSALQLEEVLDQASEISTLETIFFEGGEPFLYYMHLVNAVSRASDMGFKTGVVTNGFWATCEIDSLAWLGPLIEAGLDILQVSSDGFHGTKIKPGSAHPAVKAAEKLGLEVSLLVTDLNDVLFRGRAAEKLAYRIEGKSWLSFSSCPYENLTDPSRVHMDPFGNIHICQGIVIGNVFQYPLKKLLEEYRPENMPVIADLVKGGPSQLHLRYMENLNDSKFADACHLCYTTRKALRVRFPEVLIPDQMYGVGV